MKPQTVRRLLAVMASLLFLAGCSRDHKPGTPEAAAVSERYMHLMSDTLANVKSFSFETSERLEAVAPSGEKRVLHFTRKVVVRRPNGLFFELRGQGDTQVEVSAYYDGRTVTLNEALAAKWSQTTVPGTLDEMLDDVARKYALPVPIGDVVYSSPYHAIIGPTTKGGLVAREEIDGVSCMKLDYADDWVEVRVWLPASGPALPKRIEIGYKQSPVPLTQQLNFTNWKLDAPVTDATFVFQPTDGNAPAEFGDFVAALVARIVPAEQHASSPTAAAKPAAENVAR